MNDISSILGQSQKSVQKFTTQVFEKDLFTIPIYLAHVNEWKQNKSKILSLIPFDSSEKYKHDPFISFTDYFGGGNYKREYTDLFKTMIGPYVKDFSKKTIYDFSEIDAIWAQKYSANDFHCPHDHGSLGYSCVFYAHFNPELHKGTHFLPPFNAPNGSKPLQEVKVREGDLLIFPSTLTHMTVPHKSNEERIIISFNLV